MLSLQLLTVLKPLLYLVIYLPLFFENIYQLLIIFIFMKFNLKKDLPIILIAAALVYIIDYVILSPLGMLPIAEFAIDVVLFYVFFKTIKSEVPKRRR